MFFSKKYINLISKGDEKKFCELVNFFSHDLLVFAMGFTKKKEIAEEIVSDVFIKIWENQKTLNKIHNLKSFLYTCVKNSCISYIRKFNKEKFVTIDELEDYLIPEIQCIEDDIINSEKIKSIYNAIEQLPPKCKMVFSLAKFNGLKHREIAEVLEISEKTVNNHLVNALKKIRENIEIK